jgi:uncharacterized protein (DUF1501 family)
MDDTNFKAYTSIRGSLALTTAELTPTVYSTANAPYAFHGKLPELASLFTSKELAVVANVGSLVQPLTRAQYQAQQAPLPLNLFSHSDQQLQWQTSIAQGQQPHGMGRPRGGLHRSAEDQLVEVSGVLFGGRQMRCFGHGRHTQPSRWRRGGSLQLTGFNSVGGIAGAL